MKRGYSSHLLNKMKGIPGLKAARDVPLAPRTTYKVGGNAGIWLAPATVDALVGTLSRLEAIGVNYYVLGGGSNVLVADSGVECVLETRGLNWTRRLSHIEIEAGAGTPLKGILATSAKEGLTGLEPLSGIPGTLGGAISMNAGGQAGQIEQVVTHVLIAGPNGAKWLAKDAFSWGYRSFSCHEPGIVAGARIRLKIADKEEVRNTIRSIMNKRLRSQPVGKRSAGCVFKNPPGSAAGALIDKAGLKGLQVGGAIVSPIHANFIVNQGGARAQDIVDLIRVIQERVFSIFHVLLQPEIRAIGISIN